MRDFATALLVLAAMPAAAQPISGSIFGRVSASSGAAVSHAPIRALNTATGAEARTYSSDDGRYEIGSLPAGPYTISVATPCCTFAPYDSDVIVLEIGRALELDVALEASDSLIALADDPGALAMEVLRRRVVSEQPVPTIEQEPNLSGIWLIEDDPFPEDPAPLPWAVDAAQQRDPNNLAEDPFARCLPGELPIPGAAIPIVTRFVQTNELLIMLFEGPPGFRQVYLDGRGHPDNPNPTWLGHSIGRWEGDTLVVDTIGFHTRGQNGAYPRSEMLRVEERYTRRRYGFMELRLVIDDPGVFTKPWVRNLHLDLVPQEELIEFVCENNKWLQGDE